jgi:K+-transporting ATPase ATPase C chain
MLRELRPVLMVFLMLTVVTGILYPLAVTGVGRALFADEAEGSVVMRDGQAAGSRLLAREFTDAGHFWSRPSATSPGPYNGASSSGSNLSPTNPALLDAIAARVAALRAADPGNTAPVPVDLVTASGSGLDPHITPAAARYQVPRVARARGLSEADVGALVARHTEGRTFGVLGEPRVNVLLLNLALDAQTR